MTDPPATDPPEADRAETDQSEAVAFLRSGRACAGCGRVEVVETHGALVFLCPDEALKIKRAVRYDYMDFTTLAARKEMLRRELSLNRPGAPALYRDVVPLTRQSDGSLALDGGGAPVEWVLRMARFPRSAELVEVAERGELDERLAERLGREIQAWHARCEIRPAGGARLIGDILDELERVLADMAEALDADRIARFHERARRVHSDQSGLLDARAEAGHVRRGHGDLHLGNIVMLEGAPVLFDALEFDETLGTCDTLYDLAFLLMDLWHRGLRGQANAVLTSYLLAAGGEEDGGTAALPLFLAVRAAIRAMTTVQSERARGVAHGGAGAAYLDAALAFLAPAPTALVAVGGLSGTGKTRLARALAPDLGAPPGAVHLRTDTERKAMAGVSAEAELGAEHYTDAARHAVYERLTARARTLLAADRSVLLDATFQDGAEREIAEAAADPSGAAFAGLWLDAPPQVLVARVAGRRGDASDADPEVLQRQLEAAAPPGSWHRIDASGSPEDTRRHARDALAPVPGVGEALSGPDD